MHVFRRLDRSAWCVAAGSLLAFAWFALRSQGLSPYVFADEWIYSSFARLTPPGEVTIPSYLYFALYGALSNVAGAEFLDASRVLNALFFAAAAPFIYLTARSVAGAWVSAFVALLAIMAPLNLFTAFYMPESTYFFGFAVLSWLALARLDLRWHLHAVLAGAVLGCMMLVKVHALFLLPALVLYLAWARWREGAVAALGAAVVAAAALFAVRLGLGWLLAGPAAVNLFGNFYGNPANGPLHGIEAILHLLPPAFISARGHLAGIALVGALPMALALLATISPAERRAAGAPVINLRLYTLLMLGAAASLAVMYTASIAHVGPDELLRLHTRYYDFAYPLLLVIAAAELRATEHGSRARRWVAAALPAAALGFAMWRLPTYIIKMTDGPDLAMIGKYPSAGHVAAGLALATLAAWLWRRRVGAAFYLFALVPIHYAAGCGATDWMLERGKVPNAFDRAGSHARRLIPAPERDNTVIAGTNHAELLRAQFQLDARKADTLQLNDRAALAPEQLPYHRKWLVVIGDHALPEGLNVVARNPAYAIVHLDGNYRPLAADKLSQALPGQVLSGVDGFAPAEPWGRWSTGKTVTLHFKEPLPATANILLTVHAFGPNVGQPFMLRAGAVERRFLPGPAPHEVFLAFPTDGRTRELVIEIPHPTVPDGAGATGADVRALGLGLSKVELGTGVPAR